MSLDVQFGFLTLQAVNFNIFPLVAQVYLEFHSCLGKKKKLLTLTHKGFLTSMPLGKNI